MLKGVCGRCPLMILFAFRRYAMLSVAWCVCLLANIAAMPAPNSALVELALCPSDAVDNLRSFCDGVATKFVSLRFRGLQLRFLSGTGS